MEALKHRCGFSTMAEMANTINSDYCIGGYKNIGIICHYEYAASIVEELIRLGHTVFNVDLINPEMDGYTYEYIVGLTDDGIWVEPMYKPDKNGNMRYLKTEADIMYVHQDCNSKVLDKIYADEVYEYSVSEYDEDEDDKSEPDSEDKCAHCEWFNGCHDGYKEDVDVAKRFVEIANDILDIFGL